MTTLSERDEPAARFAEVARWRDVSRKRPWQCRMLPRGLPVADEPVSLLLHIVPQPSALEPQPEAKRTQLIAPRVEPTTAARSCRPTEPLCGWIQGIGTAALRRILVLLPA